MAESQKRGPLKVFELRKKVLCVPSNANDVSAVITYKNGKKQKREINYGSSFLSQSGRFLEIDSNVVSVQITDSYGKVGNANYGW